MPEPSHHPGAVAELAALIATLDAVSLVADWAADDGTATGSGPDSCTSS